MVNSDGKMVSFKKNLAPNFADISDSNFFLSRKYYFVTQTQRLKIVFEKTLITKKLY